MLICYSLFSNASFFTSFSPKILQKLLFSNALGDIAYSQEHLKTIVYAKFWGGNKVYYGAFENREWVAPTL